MLKLPDLKNIISNRIGGITGRFRRGAKHPVAKNDDAVFESDNDVIENNTTIELAEQDHGQIGHESPKKKDNFLPRKLFGAKTNDKPYVIIGTLNDMHRLCIDPPSTKTTVLLAGELVLLSDTEVENLADYSRQTDRITRSIGDFAKRSAPFSLKVWLHRNVIDSKRILKRHRFCFLIDQYLQYGKSQKDDFRLVTGSSGNNETIIQIFTFERGNLISIDEKILPDVNHARFDADYNELLHTLSRAGVPVTIADPLPNPENSQYSYIGNSIYRKPTVFMITDEESSPSFISVHGSSVAVIAVAITAYILATVFPYNQYKHAANEFQRVAASVPTSDLAFGSAQLQTMQKRRFFLVDARQQQQTVKLMRNISYALSSEGVIIKNILLSPVKAKTEDPDISITVLAKRIPNQTVLEQARPLIDHLSAKLGINNLRLAHNGYRDQKSAEENYIQYNIEGDLKEKS